MGYKCPTCKNRQKPKFIGIINERYLKTIIYECQNCHGKGTLAQFETNEVDDVKSALISLI